MKEIVGNIWDLHEAGAWIGVTTNGMVKQDGTAVMGKGIALEAAKLFPRLPAQLAFKLKSEGNRVFFFLEYRIITIPTKSDWRQDSDLGLIEKSCMQLSEASAGKIFIPPLGCGSGNLVWSDVRKAIAPILNQDWFIVVHPEAIP